MIKNRLLYLVTVLALCAGLVSCSSTSVMTKDPLVTDTSTDLPYKLNALGFPSARLRDIQVFYEGDEWIEAATEYVKKAKSYIFISSFLVSECDENKAFFQALAEKAREGVEIYFLFDSAGDMDMTESKYHMRSIEYLREEGVHLYKYNPFSLNRLVSGAKLFIREHRKQVIIDGHTVMTGGMNFNFMSDISSKDKGQRDSMYIFESPEVARILSEQFMENWNTYSWEEIASLPKAVDVSYPEDGYLDAWVVNQSDDKVIMPALFGSLFSSAKSEILCLPLLPLLNSDMAQSIKNATERGVEFKIILPNDPRTLNFKAAHYSVKDLQSAGITVFSEKALYNTENLLHEKLIVVDGQYTVIGSVNLNYRSMVLSNEIALVIDSPEFASLVRSRFMTLAEDTIVLTEDLAEQWRTFSGLLSFIIAMMAG